MSGVSVKFGPHKVSWRFADSGETVQSTNESVLNSPPRSHRFLCVHVYPDQTSELVTSEYFPDKTERGIAMGDALRRSHGR